MSDVAAPKPPSPATRLVVSAEISDEQGNEIRVERRSAEPTLRNAVALAVSSMVGIGVPVPVLVQLLREHANLLEHGCGCPSSDAHLPPQHPGRN